MIHETLIVERDGPVLKVTMNRPDARNALSPVMVRELTEVFQGARDDAEVRAVDPEPLVDVVAAEPSA